MGQAANEIRGYVPPEDRDDDASFDTVDTADSVVVSPIMDTSNSDTADINADNSVDMSAAESADDSGDTEEIRAQIEQTRSNMSSTIDAIQEKLSPDNLKEHAKEVVREATVGRAEDFVSNASQTAKGFGEDMLETIKQNPVPAALAGIGLAWLFMKNGSRTSGSQGSAQYHTHYYGQYPQNTSYARQQYGSNYGSQGGGVGDVASRAGEKVGDVVGGAGDKVGQVAGAAGDKVGQVVGAAGDVVGAAGEKVGQVGDQAQYKAEQATDWFQRSLRENPLAVGAVAAALGVAVGLMLPETQQEHQMMGQARDNLLDKAQNVVQDTVDKVQRVAGEAQNTIKQEAQNQGLTPEGMQQSMSGQSA